MANTNDISELLTQVCQKMIDYGVQPHTAWQDYSFNYRPIYYYFQDHHCSVYNEDLLSQYSDEMKSRYDAEEFTHKNYLARLRAVSRLREFYQTGVLTHVIANGHSRKHLVFNDETLLMEFLEWSGPLKPHTRQDMDWAVRSYLYWLEQQGIRDGMEATAHSFAGFLSAAAMKYSDGSLHDLQLYLKKFHHFLNEAKGMEIPYEFVLSLPVVREKKVFRPLTQDEIRRTIAQIDRSTVIGKRDYAIVLLSARCGLRGIDILHLKLTDIDWRGGCIRLIQKKTGVPVTLPLLDDVGEALKEYILNGRPHTSCEYIFLRAIHPYHPFQRSIMLTHMWGKYQEKAGIERYARDGKGFHALRRSLGKELTLAGIPVTTTAQILGHRNPDSTKQYISLDSEHLKECALDLSGIEITMGGYGHE